MISTYTLNHFGIVAGICKELEIAETIDDLIPPDPQQKVTTGQAVVSMIINGLGFSNRRLYLYPQFFENKPVDLLVGGRNLTADDLNDDTIGRALDRVFKYGCTELFCYDVSHQATVAAGVNKKFGHLDTTWKWHRVCAPLLKKVLDFECPDNTNAVNKIHSWLKERGYAKPDPKKQKKKM